MICKSCGQQFSGTHCPKCGREVFLIKRSTELDSLMKNEKSPQSSYEDGYQAGLRAGYENGLKDSESEKFDKGITIPREKLPVYAAYAGVILVILLILCIFIGSLADRSSGYNRGWNEALQSQELASQLERTWREGYQIGYETAINEAKEATSQSVPIDQGDIVSDVSVQNNEEDKPAEQEEDPLPDI